LTSSGCSRLLHDDVYVADSAIEPCLSDPGNDDCSAVRCGLLNRTDAPKTVTLVYELRLDHGYATASVGWGAGEGHTDDVIEHTETVLVDVEGRNTFRHVFPASERTENASAHAGCRLK
jgi:hypothetical protein